MASGLLKMVQSAVGLAFSNGIYGERKQTRSKSKGRTDGQALRARAGQTDKL